MMRPPGLTAPMLAEWLRVFARLVSEHEDQLNSLDAAIGDADHGTNLTRGFQAVADNLRPGTYPAALLTDAGHIIINKTGGAAGPLFGTFFLGLADAVGNNPLTPTTFTTGLQAGLTGVVTRGRAEPGDKTMYDTLAPAITALTSSITALARASTTDQGGPNATPTHAPTTGQHDPGATLSQASTTGQHGSVAAFTYALQAARRAAEAGRDATIPMLARKGRASYLGERTIGHQDPGATSAALLFTAAATALPLLN
ncbi:DAK2 domain-containing protein [Kribbella solani]|uniref:DAK2 domain-containing protein n=1 Tax=Kribbella solani TaxID=236067 RepID=UPI0029AD06A2|nr:DAK2 domain-containing protein [Kribbella solani]MDX3003736.1 DAK2 domain-containing protein [Kribbella solani]